MSADLPKGSFCLEGHIDVPADQLATVREALKVHVDLTRQEAGCIYFNVDASPDVDGRFSVSEAFVDEAAFQYHQERAGSSAWAKVTRDVSRDYKTWVVE